MAKKIDSSSIIEMQMTGEEDSDYENNYADQDSRQRTRNGGHSEEPGFQQQLGKNMASYVWKSGRERAAQAFSIYGNIDVLRPYFDVEPSEVRNRLLRSLVPRLPGSQREKIPRELYGPTMIVFTLIALLLLQMKSSGHTVQEGTLMGSAIGTCFGYWLGVSALGWMLAYVCNTHVTMLQIMSLLGYALFAHCVVLFVGTVYHTSHDHLMFYLLWGVFGGLSSLKMVSLLSSRTAGQSQKLIICGVIATLHLLFLLYLHFQYHNVVEELSAVLDQPIIPAHKAPLDGAVGSDSLHDTDELAVAPAANSQAPLVEQAVGHSVQILKEGAQIVSNLTAPAQRVVAPLLQRLVNDSHPIDAAKLLKM